MDKDVSSILGYHHAGSYHQVKLEWIVFVLENLAGGNNLLFYVLRKTLEKNTVCEQESSFI